MPNPTPNSTPDPVLEIVARLLIPESGVRFVLDVLVTASQMKFKATGHSEPLDVELICSAFDTYAREYFNDPQEAIELLEEWEIFTSDQLGEVVEAIAGMGKMKLIPGQTPESLGASFEGRFSVRGMFEAQ